MDGLLDDYPFILTVSDVSKILGISPNTTRKLIRNHSLQGVKIGRRYKIVKPVLLDYLVKNGSPDHDAEKEVTA